MCRRFRRVRRLAQQVVTVTRRLWRVCQCCGNLTAAPRQEVVPLAAVIENPKAARSSSSTAQDKSVSICWNCPIGVSLASGSSGKAEHTFPVPNTEHLGEKIDLAQPAAVEKCKSTKSNLGLAADEKTERWSLKQYSQLQNVEYDSASNIYDDKYSIPQSECKVQRKPTTSTLNESNLALSLAADTESGSIGMGNRESSDRHLTLKSTENRQSVYPSGTISRSSQTEDFVSTQFYAKPSGSISRVSRTDMTLSPESRSSTRFYPLERIDTFGIAGTDATPTAKVFNLNTLADLNEAKCSISTLSFGWEKSHVEPNDVETTPNQVMSRFSLKSCLSKNDSPFLTRPPNLTVEYAIVKDWYRIYPLSWTMEKNITITRTGRVDLVFLAGNKRHIALKTVKTSKSVKESQILIQCQGPYVAQLCACMVQGGERYLCMTYYTRGDLSKWLEKDTKQKYFKEHEAVWIIGYILAAIEFLHNNGVLHLDIKSSNTLINNQGYPVLSDFGSAVRIGEVSTLKDSVPFTPAYASPEIQAAQKPDSLADLWSAACIFNEIITKSLPHRSLTRCETLLKTAIGSPLDVSMMSTEAGDFLTSQLKINKRERLGYSTGAREVMRHAIFKSVDWHEIKYGSRLMDCRLLRVFEMIEKDQELNNLSDSTKIELETILDKGRNNNRLETSPTCPLSDFGYAVKESYSWSLWEEDADHMDIVSNAAAAFFEDKRNFGKIVKMEFWHDPT